MSLLLPISVALLVSGQIPLSLELEVPTGDKVYLESDSLTFGENVITAHGNVVLRSGEVTLRSDELTYDRNTERATTRGHVMLVSGLFAAVADAITVDIKSYEAFVEGGLFMQKKGVTPEALMSARTPDELKAVGETPVLITGTHIKRTGKDAFLVDDLSFTPCECDPKEPSWRVEAKRAQVEMGEKAILTWPVVYVYSVPVFALPWLYLPLAERRTGLLVPRPLSSSNNGFSLEQPVFVTLGRSYDLTFTPAYYFGSGDVTRPVRGTAEALSVPRDRGIKGPRLLTEFRYAPSPNINGRATLGFLYDLQPVRDPRLGQDAFYLAEAGGIVRTPRGLRSEATLQHTQELGRGWSARVEASAVSDGFYLQDFTTDILARETGFLRSMATLFHRDDDAFLGLDLTFRQDLRAGYSLLGEDRIPSTAAAGPGVVPGAIIPGPRTFQRVPGLTFALPERPLLGALSGSLRGELVRLAPMLASFGDEGVNGRFDPDGQFDDDSFYGPDPRQPDPLQSNGTLDGRDREARVRLDVMPRLAASVPLGPYARLTPSLALRQDAWLGEVSGRVDQRGYPLASLTLDSELARTFQSRHSQLRHTLAPSLELRYVPGAWGGVPTPAADRAGPPQPYDEVDASVQFDRDSRFSPRFLQAVALLRQTLRVRGTGGPDYEALRLDLGQGFDLTALAPSFDGRPAYVDRVRLSESFARLTAGAGPFRGGLGARFDPELGRFTQISADASIDNGRGEALYANAIQLLETGTDQLRRPIDALFGPPPTLYPNIATALRLVGGLRMNLPLGLGGRYEAIVEPGNPRGRPLAQQTIGLSYGPACDCWRVEVAGKFTRDDFAVSQNPNAPPRFDLGFGLSISRFGSFASGG